MSSNLDKTMIEEQFSFGRNVECHALDYNADFNKIVPIAVEHGFGGIVTLQGRVAQLKRAIIQNKIEAKERPRIISTIDFPLGSQSTDTRAYQIHSIKESGADAVEVVAPYHLMAEGDTKGIYKDVDTLSLVAKECGIELRYVIDVGCEFYDKKTRNILLKRLIQKDVRTISASLGYYNRDVDISDVVLWIFNIKKISGCNIKTYICGHNAEDIVATVKAGSATVGLEWDRAVEMTHEYERLIRSNKN